jgi:hypothetical protein
VTQTILDLADAALAATFALATLALIVGVWRGGRRSSRR